MIVDEHTIASVKHTPKPWAVSTARRAEELYKTMPAKEVAQILGRTKKSVESRLHASKTAVTKRPWRHWTAADDAYLMSTSDKTAAKHLNRSVAACKSHRLVLKQLVKTAEGDSK